MKTLISDTFTELIVETTENPLFETLWSTLSKHSRKETQKLNYLSAKYGFFPKWNLIGLTCLSVERGIS